MAELNLLNSFQKVKRKIEKGWRTEENKRIAKLYGKEFFDGDRVNGYGGYYYDGRWKKVVQKLQEIYKINKDSSVLDIGCAKGFLLYDLQDMIPGIKIAGLEISEYAINQADKKVSPFLIKGSADELPYPDNSFDVVLSINTAHNLPKEKCKKAIQEMMRVCKPDGNMYIQVDAYRTPEEKERMEQWVLTAETAMSVDEWLEFFKEVEYKGDYFWTIV